MNFFAIFPTALAYRIADSANSEYDRPSLKYMSVTSDVMSVVTDLGAPGHMFRFSLLFKTIYQLLIVDMEGVVDPTTEEDVQISKDLPTQRAQCLRSRKGLHCVTAPDLYYSSSQVKCLYEMSVADCTIHFWREWLPNAEI